MEESTEVLEGHTFYSTHWSTSYGPIQGQEKSQKCNAISAQNWHVGSKNLIADYNRPIQIRLYTTAASSEPIAESPPPHPPQSEVLFADMHVWNLKKTHFKCKGQKHFLSWKWQLNCRLIKAVWDPERTSLGPEQRPLIIFSGFCSNWSHSVM